MNLNIKAKKKNTFDAIVVGSGISGGWAAKELTEKGLNVLVLERGRDVKHGEYPTMYKKPWELPYGDQLTAEEKKDYQVQLRTGYTVKQSTKHWWVKDTEEPYTEIQRFDWMRGYHVGGRSLLWGRQSYRWSEMDFESNVRDGHGVDWPIRYNDLAPWYSHVEKFIGVSGRKEGLKQLPDSEFLPEMEMNCVEEHVRDMIAEKFEDRMMTIGRVAHATEAINGRGPCQYRNMCIRGCPYGGYFSSNSSTLPAAFETGNLTLRPYSIVREIIYDAETQQATGVRVIDSESLEEIDFHAKIIFLNASTVGSTAIMLNSVSDRFPEGFGNDSGELGRNMMDHHLDAGAYGSFEEHEEFEDKYYYGRRPNGIYIPRFRNIETQETDYLRGFGYQGGASRGNWQRSVPEMTIGKDLKAELAKPGPWTFGIGGFGEFLPYYENRMTMNNELLSKWGLPTVTFDVGFKENELKMRKDMVASAKEILEAAGAQNIQTFDEVTGPGLGIHEMGTARMGKDPNTSVLNGFNQVHASKNVFVTDGACMTSSACQNPSLTYMAITARAANYAVSEISKGNL